MKFEGVNYWCSTGRSSLWKMVRQEEGSKTLLELYTVREDNA